MPSVLRQKSPGHEIAELGGCSALAYVTAVKQSPCSRLSQECQSDPLNYCQGFAAQEP